ncbi:MAG: hypothetical protein GQ574_29030 [Crocinitomix sp.]|nr:hypothetical protein [Crocinitomix sp.]
MKIELLKQKFERFKLLNKGINCYHIGTVMLEDEVSAFECKYSIQIPKEFRYFLLNIANGIVDVKDSINSVVEPLNLQGILYSKGYYNLEKPFPLTAANFKFDADYPFEIMSEKLVGKSSDGTIPVQYSGCGASDFIVINGSESGNVWCSNEAGDGSVFPFFNSDSSQRRYHFIDWIIVRLDEAIDLLESINPKVYYENLPFGLDSFHEDDFFFSYKNKEERLASDAYFENTENIEPFLADIKAKYGYEFPKQYLALLRKQNGGELYLDTVQLVTNNFDISNSVRIMHLYGMGDINVDSLYGELGKQMYFGFGIEKTVVFAGGGNLNIFFDYSNCALNGEPRIGFKKQGKTVTIADSFKELLEKLTSWETYRKLKNRELIENIDEIAATIYTQLKADKANDFYPLFKDLLMHCIADCDSFYPINRSTKSFYVFVAYLFIKNAHVMSLNRIVEKIIKVKVDFNKTIDIDLDYDYQKEEVSKWMSDVSATSLFKRGVTFNLKMDHLEVYKMKCEIRDLSL